MNPHEGTIQRGDDFTFVIPGKLVTLYMSLILLFLSVDATQITMTPHTGTIQRGDDVTFVCETDAASPDPPEVSWTIDNKHLTNGNKFRIVNEYSNGDYSGRTTKSTLTFTVWSSDNRKTLKCALKTRQNIEDHHQLIVECK